VNYLIYESSLKANYSEGENPRTVAVTPIKTVRCNNTRFKGQADSRDNITNWRCPETVNIPLHHSTKLRMLLIQLNYCTNASLQQFYPGTNMTCKTREETNAVLPLVTYNVAYIQQTLDASDFEDPIKYNLQAT
jgi:hypothetical protein